MKTPIKILRLYVPGMQLLNSALSAWYDMIERHDNLQAEWPVLVDRKSFGDLIKFDQKVIRPPRIMFVTTEISAMSGDTTGSGQAVDAAYDRATGNLTAGTTPPATVRNYHEKRFLEGAIIAAFPQYGTLWAFDVNRCDNYQA